MGRIVFSVILLVLITMLIVLNLGPTTTVNLFGVTLQDVPLVAVAMLSFALGVVYSFVLYAGQYFHRKSLQRLEKRNRDMEERERKLATTESGAEEKQESAPNQSI
jgi:uncharacterized integral membrane protein